MTLTGDRGNHPEPTYPHSPEAAAGTSPSTGGGSPAHHAVLARLLAADPALAAASLANLIASERESARAEALSEAAAAIEAELAREEKRLAGLGGYGVGMLANWLGGIKVGATLVRDLANTT